MYHGFARSAGFDYWESAGYTFAGSAMWEIAGETTPPSRNDQVASGIGGTLPRRGAVPHGEPDARARRRDAARSGARTAAAAISPSTGFNRLVFGDRYGSRLLEPRRGVLQPAAGRLQRQRRTNDRGTSTASTRNEVQVDFSLDYGMPGKDGYEYTRPFDYFAFQATASSANGFENVLTRGLLVGTRLRGRPRLSRRLGPVRQLRLHLAADLPRLDAPRSRSARPASGGCERRSSLQGTALAGLGYAAVGTTHGTVERPRLPLRRHAAGAARAARHLRRQAPRST